MDGAIDPEIQETTGQILSAAFAVSSALGHGFLEGVYRKALLHELMLRGLRPREEVHFRVRYRDADCGSYIADLVVDGRVIVELKAVAALLPAHRAQLLNYLRASGLRAGLLLNFGTPKLTYARVLNG
ncbi:GxxExxY protein [Rhodocista pekingensis]|uniref:GxxExxY protein n=1 Tax=Rhodocista pekingensis TaxID=201185 RepID=A0ABW2KT67_9PROT